MSKDKVSISILKGDKLLSLWSQWKNRSEHDGTISI